MTGFGQADCVASVPVMMVVTAQLFRACEVP